MVSGRATPKTDMSANLYQEEDNMAAQIVQNGMNEGEIIYPDELEKNEVELLGKI